MSAADLPELVTERLSLAVPTEVDADAMWRFVIANRDHFAPWEPIREPEYFTEAYWRRELASVEDRAIEGTGVQFVLRYLDAQDPEIIGQCTLSAIMRGSFQAAFLGYGLDHREQGKGLMTEALVAVIRFAFEDLGLHRVMANYMPENDPSRRVLERLGFVREGYARDYLRLAGRWQDHVLTALVNDDWSPD